MRKINPSFITSAAKQPFTQGTWTHLQLAYQEAISAMVQQTIGIAYDPTKVYILFGCVATGTDPGARTFTAGAVFFDGEVYLVPAASYTSSGSNVAVGTIVITPYTGTGGNADPLEFTDLSTHNVHDIRTMNITAAASGSGTADFNTWLTIDSHTTSNQSGSAVMAVGTGTISSVTFNWSKKGNMMYLSFAVGITSLTPGGGNAVAINITLPQNVAQFIAYGNGIIKNTTDPYYSCIVQADGSFPTLLGVSSVVGSSSTLNYSISGSIAYAMY